MTGIPIGAGIQLPDSVKNSKSIISLTRDKTHFDFDDNKCLFRCLALHFDASLHSLESEANRLKEKFEEHTGKSYNAGIEVKYVG